MRNVMVKSEWKLRKHLPFSEITIETDITLPATLTIYSTLGEELFSVQIVEEQSKINFGKIQINSETIEGSVFMKLFDISGRCVWNGHATINEIIDISALPDGMYYYHFLVGNNTYVGNISIVKE